MSEQLETQTVESESVSTPETTEGLSERVELPEEYKPYSDIPWDGIPEEQREAVLKGLKKFHGGMTKGQQDQAKLKSQIAELSVKAEYLDQLIQQPWVKEAWKRQQLGQSAPPAEAEKPLNLSEHLDPEAAKTVEALIEREVSKRLAPLSAQVSGTAQDLANSRAKQELSELSKKAEAQGWPSPYERLDQMAKIVAAGRATNVEDAYRLSTFDEMPDMVKEKTRATIEEQFKSKASKTVPATQGSFQNGKVQQLFSGKDAVLNALRESKRELGMA